MHVCLYIHTYIQTHIPTPMHAWVHACIHTYLYMTDMDIQAVIVLCLQTYIHPHMISVFQDFCDFHISANQEIMKSGNSKNMEVQESEVMYICRQSCIFVCIHV